MLLGYVRQFQCLQSMVGWKYSLCHYKDKVAYDPTPQFPLGGGTFSGIVAMQCCSFPLMADSEIQLSYVWKC